MERRSADRRYGGELGTAEGLALIDDLAAFGVPVLPLSGGEPLVRPDILDLIGRARERGLTGDWLESDPYCVHVPARWQAKVPGAPAAPPGEAGGEARSSG